MKKIFLAFAALAAMTSVSCKQGLDINPVEQMDKTAASIKLSTRALDTRAAGDTYDTVAERAINRVEVFFFRQDEGQTLDAYYSFTSPDVEDKWQDPNVADDNDFILGTEADPMYVSNTTLDVYVVVNAPASGADGYIGDQVTSVATLKEQISQFTVNTASNFVMIGRLAGINMKAIAADAAGIKTIATPVELERMCNKVILHNIKKDFVSPAFQAATVQLEGLYIVNAVKEAKYAEVYTAAGERKVDAVPAAEDASYYNATFTAASGWADNAFITNTFAAKLTVGATATAVDECLYFYPNPAIEAVRPAPDATTGEQQPIPEDYVTKLVLKVKIGDNHYWYPIAINQAKLSGENYTGAPMDFTRNFVYVIDDLTLLKAGNNANKDGDEENTPDDPDDPYNPVDDPNEYIDNSSVSLKLLVLDWVSGEIVGSYNGHGWGIIE